MIRERASILSYTYIARLVVYFVCIYYMFTLQHGHSILQASGSYSSGSMKCGEFLDQLMC